MKLETFKHEDGRRKMVELFRDFPIRTVKVLYVKKKDEELGNHYHKLKDDIFFLIKGSGVVVLDYEYKSILEGDCIFVPAGVKHTFRLSKMAILLECSTLPYDKNDEYPI